MHLIRNHKGFTLLELMVVVIIVMVLAGIAVPVYMHYVREAKKSEAYAVIDAAVAGAKVYFQRNETFENGTFTLWLAQDDVDNAEYFTYAISDDDANGFTITATESGDWAPAGATITWTQEDASAQDGNAGTGEFDEDGW